MPAKRRLEDLFVIGKLVTVDDHRGEPVQVWLQKLNPVELNSALRMANAERARVRTVKRDPTSDEYMAMWLDVLDWERKEDLVEYLVAEPLLTIHERYEAELAAEDEWAKDDYLQGLRDAWDNGLSVRFAEDGDDVDARRVFSELERFTKIVAERSAPAEAEARAELNARSMEALQQEALDRQIQYKSNAAWLEAFHRGELLFGVRDPDDHKARYFQSRGQLDDLSAEVMRELIDAYQGLSVEVSEGKDSAATPTSSDSSEQSAGEAPPVRSGLAVVGR